MKRLKFSKSSCIGCQLCAQVCSAMHEGEFIPSKARINIESYYDKGGDLKYKDSFCILCGICKKAMSGRCNFHDGQDHGRFRCVHRLRCM